MSDYDDDLDSDTTDASEQKRNWRRDLEEQAKAAKQAAAEAEAAKRELALIRAGIDLDSPHGKLAAKAYDGPADPAQIKAWATEHGILEPEAPVVPEAELAAHERVANAASGATQVSDSDAALAELEKAGDFFSGSPQQVLEVLAKYGITAENSRPGNWQRTDATKPL